MLKKGISPAIATILLIVITVLMASITYLWFSGMFQRFLSQSEKQVEYITDVSLLQIVYAYFSGVKVGIYDIYKDNFSMFWGAYNSSKIAKKLFECGYYVDLLTSEELDKIYNYDVFILSTGECYPATKPMKTYDPTVKYIKYYQDFVINKGKNLVLIAAYPLHYPGYINKTTGLPVIYLPFCPKVSQTIINGYSITFCDSDKDDSYDYFLEFQCITYKQNPDNPNYYICNDFIAKDFGFGSNTMAYYFGLAFGDVLCSNDQCNSIKSPIAQKLFPEYPNSISSTVRPMGIWNNPNNKFLGKIRLIHLWNDTLGTKTTDNQNASHITIALYPSGGKVFHMFGSIPSNLDELGLDFLCKVIYVLTSYDFNKDSFTKSYEDITYPIRLIVYNPSNKPININNTYFSINNCMLKLKYNKTFLTEPKNKYIIYPNEQIILKVNIINCHLERNKEYLACLIYQGKKTCGWIKII